VTDIANIARVSRSTVTTARNELAAAPRRKPGPKPRETAQPATRETSPKAERRGRAQRFLREQLARGAKQVSDVEEAAARRTSMRQRSNKRRADLGVLTTRANTGGAHAVQWNLPG